MAGLKGTKTEENLKAAFAGESQANRRYLYFAQKADVEGYNDVAAVFRSTAEGETDTLTGILSILRKSVTPQQVNRSVIQPVILRLQWLVKPMSTPICIREWRKKRGKRALTR